MRSLVLSFIFLSAQGLLAQNYLVKTNGDTLRGSIVFQLMGKIESATVKGGKRETVSAINTREILMKGKRFKPVQFNNSILFMEILSDGYLSLLAFQPSNIMAYDGRLLQKRDGKILEVSSLGFKRQMVAYLSDCPDLASKIKEGELGSKDLNEIIKQYNDFISNNTKSSNPESKLDAEQLSKMDLLNSLKSEIEKSDLPSKQDALDILSELAEKIKEGKAALPYMVKALNTALEPRKDLLEKLDELTKN